MLGRGYSLVAVKVQKKANGRVKRFRMRRGSVARFVWIWLIAVSAVVSVGLLACETAEPTPIEPTRLPSATVAPVVRVEPTLVVVPTRAPVPTVTPSPTVTPTTTQLPTVTPSPTVTTTATRTVGPTMAPAPTETQVPSPTEAMSSTPMSVATATPVLTDTPTATVVSSPTDTVEPEPEATVTATVTPTSVATVTPTPTATVEVEEIVELVVVATVIVGPKLPDDFVAPPVRRSGLFPAITTISESDIEELQANRSQVYRFRSNPVPIGEVLTVSNWSMRLVAVERTEPGAGSVCRAETGEVCLRIEFEIANLWDLDGDRGVYNDEFELVGERGFAYGEGGWHYGDCYRRCEPVRLDYGELTTIEIYRFAPSDEAGLVLVVDEDYSHNAFWLESDPITRVESEVMTVATPGAMEVGSVGTWIGNAVPVGEAVTVDAFAVRVLEVERGWDPGAERSVPTVLLTSESNEYVAGVSRRAFDERRESDREVVEELLVETELIRVRFEATNVGSYSRKTLIDAANFVLVDGDRRVYTGGFYPKAGVDLKYPGQTLFHFGVKVWPQQNYRQAEVYGGGTVSEEIAWLIPKDATGLTLVYLPFRFEGGGFLALDDTARTAAGDIESPSWLDEALAKNGTWPSRPAPLGIGVRYKDGVAVRVAAVESASGACDSRYEAIAGKDCLRVTLDFWFEATVGRRSIFETDEVSFVIDGEVVTVQRRHSENSYTALIPRFESLLDWAEDGRDGVVRATYSAEVQSGWREALLVYSPYANTPAVYLWLAEPVRDVAAEELRAAVVATVSAVSDEGDLGLFEFLDESGFELVEGDDLVGGYLGGLMAACVAYVARPTEHFEAGVLESLQLVGATRVGELAPAYFESPDDAALTCGKSFPASSKKMVLTIMLGLAQYGCIFGGQGAFGATPSGAMELGESMFRYWGEDSPVMMSDFASPMEFCGWIFDGENQALLELIDGTNLAIFE